MATNKIDVLDVMQRASLRIADLSDGCKTATEADLQEARAAVAELIRAADDYADVIENAYDITQTAPAKARLRAALARVGGAS